MAIIITFESDILKVLGFKGIKKTGYRDPYMIWVFQILMIVVKIVVKILTFTGTSIIKKAKILKIKQRKKIKTHKQANDQTNKQTNKQRNKQKQRKQTSDVACFFWSDAMAGAIACGQTILMKRQQAKKTNKRCRLFFFGPMQWLEPLRAAKRYK